MDEETRNVMEAGFRTLADLIRETNTELSSTRSELRNELKATRHELKAEIAGTRRDLTEQIAATNGRLDNLIVIAGEQTRGLRADVASLEARVEALEQKAS